MRTYLFIGVAAAALLSPAAAMAQSSGSVEANADADIVVTGARQAKTDGIVIPNTTKAKGVLTQEFISHATPGQSIDDTINNLPGVSFQNNDPFGNAGGTLTIRGFDGSRISQTFDGVPLNDTGNYAIYSNQQLDPELIQQVSVNLGSTDVDSPSASATGATVNYTTVKPTDEFGVRVVGSVGDFNFFRVFGQVNTGVFTKFGTKAWFAASDASNNVVFNDFGKIHKQQYNFMIEQPIGSNGDYIRVAGNWNQNRNNFFGSVPLRSDRYIFSQTGTTNPVLVQGAARTVGTASTNRFPDGSAELPYHVARCQTVAGTAGVADGVNTCGTSYDERYNPSNNGNLRLNAKLSITDKLTLFFDPSYQYVKANGGGTVSTREGAFTRVATATAAAITTPLYGFIGGNYYTGVDLNGDGDTRDTVTYLAPSQTVTHRYGLISSLRYEFSDTQTVRVGYSHDYGRHRQTGELGALLPNGVPIDVFPINNPLIAANGTLVEKRDRLSYAVLDEASGEYIGKFFDSKLVVDAGVRAPFYIRNLNNYCFTTSAAGFVDCLGINATGPNATYAAANPYVYNSTTGTVTSGYATPQSRRYTYNRVLPSAGLTFQATDTVSVYGNYSKGLQVPGTDNLYNAFYFPVGTVQSTPLPETTDNFDAGIRYTSPLIQASVGPWYTRFTNRLASAFDPDTQATVYRNLGRVDKYGVDGQLTVRPFRPILVYVFGSYLKSQIKNNIQIGSCPLVLTTANTTNNCTVANAPIFAATAGKRESGAPVYTFGGRLQGEFGPLTIGMTGKATGERYLDDQNLALTQCTSALVNTVCPTAANVPTTYTGTRGFQYSVQGAKAAAYATVDFDVRMNLGFLGLNNSTYFQFNLENAFNQFYVGGVSGGQTLTTTVPFAQIGSPRAFIGSINVQF